MEKDIFEDFRKLVGCDSVSDLRYRKGDVLDVIEKIRFSDHPPEKVNEFFDYVF